MAVLDLIPKKKAKAPKGFAMPAIDVPRYTPALIPRETQVPPRLARKLVALGRRYRSVNITTRVAQYIANGVMLVTLQMTLDWLVNLHVLLRLLLLAGDIALLVYFVRKQLLPLLRPPNIEAAALLVEKHFPKLRGRIIAAVQLGRPGFTRDSPELVQAIQQDTDLRTASTNFGSIVPTRGLRRRLWIALAVVASFVAAMVALAPGSIALLERVFLISVKVPRKTEVICLSGNMTVPAGESVLLEAQARGILPAHGRVTLTDSTGRIQEITIDPEKDHPDRFSLKIDSVEQPLTYTVVLNDGSAGPYDVKTVPRPNVLSIDCVQVYPAYTGLPDAKRSVGNLALLAGSKLKIHATANSKIVKAALKLIGLDKTLPLTIGGTGQNELTAQIDIPPGKLSAFSLQLTNEAGITSGDETQYRIDLIPDRPPAIQLTYPDRLEELDTLKAKPTIGYAGSDDYGLAKVWFCYRFVREEDNSAVDASGNPLPPPPATKIAMDIGTGRPLSLKAKYILDFATLKPTVTEGVSIEYWMQAEDANTVTGPGQGESEHHVIRVVSEAEKKAEIMQRFTDSLGTLDEQLSKQTNMNDQLGNAIATRPNQTAPLAPNAPAPAPVSPK